MITSDEGEGLINSGHTVEWVYFIQKFNALCFILTKSNVAFFQCPRNLVVDGVQDFSSRELQGEND